MQKSKSHFNSTTTLDSATLLDCLIGLEHYIGQDANLRKDPHGKDGELLTISI